MKQQRLGMKFGETVEDLIIAKDREKNTKKNQCMAIAALTGTLREKFIRHIVTSGIAETEIVKKALEEYFEKRNL